MKRNERNNYNHIARDIRKNGIESIINIEVPTNYTHEARQAFHELLTAYNLRAVCIYWNDIEKTWALHYEPAHYPEAHDEKRRQEAEDVDAVTARMTRRNWTWNGYPAPAAEAEQQPTETENAPQAATQAAEGTDEKKEAETMTTTEREALERINARQNAANLFTNITPADIAAELAAMEAERTTPAPDPDAVTLAPADAACVWDEDGNTITPEETTTDEQKEEDKTMSTPNKLYLSNWNYNAALIIEELAAIVENNGGTVKPGTEAIIENRALNENLRKAADRLTQLESIEAEAPGTNEHRTDAIKRLRADIEKWERIDNTPRTVHHCTWSSAYISFKLGGMYYYYQTDSNPFFDFHYQKTPIDINGTVSRCACLENDPKEWLYDCFFRAEATDADRREAANLIYNMLVKAAPSVIRRDSHRVRVRNQYDGRYHYETVYEKERREAVNF